MTDDAAAQSPELHALLMGHLGLAGMGARAEKLGGRLDVRSEPGAGTSVTAEIAVQEAAAHPAGSSTPDAAKAAPGATRTAASIG